MENHDLTINRMNVSLPSEMRGQERIFSQHLANEFGRLQIKESANISQINLPPMTSRPGETSILLAKRVAHEVSNVIMNHGNHSTQGGAL